MFVPAIAFAWWLVALPMKALPVAALGNGDADGALAPPSGAPRNKTGTIPADDTSDTSGERVPLRGPIPTEVVRTAQTFLDLPMGAERVVRLDETDYVFVLEWHYHPRGFVGAPTGWHKGVTVYLVR
jgi:hypothetical protein